MKPVVLFVLIHIYFYHSVLAQNNRPDIFRGQTIVNPERYGNGVFVHIVRGDNLMLQSDFEDAIIAYDNAIAQNPSFAEAYIKRAMAKYRLGWSAQAQQDYEYAVRLNPLAADLYGYKNHYRKLNILAFKPEQLLYRPSLQERLNNYYNLHSLYLVDGHEYQGLTAGIEDESKINIDNLFYIQKAISWMKEGQMNIALAALDDAIALQPNAIAFDLKGLVYSEMNELEQAQAMYQTAIGLDSSYSFAYYNLSLLKWSERQLNEAWAFADRAISLDTNLFKAYFQRAALAKTLGKSEAALADYDKLLNITSDYHEEILLNRAISRKLSGDVLGAMDDLNHAILLDPAQAKSYYMRGNINVLLGHYYTALDDYTRAIELNHDYTEALYNRGITYLMLYNYPDGCYDLEQAVRLGYKEGEIGLQRFCGF